MPKSKKSEKKRPRIKITPSSGNIFKDSGFSDAEAANLMARFELMLKIRDIISANGWSQREAAKVLGVSQPRIAEIHSFNTTYFSVDLLLKYLARLGTKVTFRFKKIDAA